MPETRQCPARVIPRRDENDALHLLVAEQLDGELRIFLRGFGLVFQFNRLGRHTRSHQQMPVDFTVPRPADDDARRDLFLEQLRRAIRPFMRTAAQHDHHFRRNRAAVQAQKWARIAIRGQRQQNRRDTNHAG